MARGGKRYAASKRTSFVYPLLDEATHSKLVFLNFYYLNLGSVISGIRFDRDSARGFSRFRI